MPDASHAPWQRLALIAADIKIGHTVFALPFAVMAAMLVAPRLPAEPAMAPELNQARADFFAPIDWTRFAALLALVVVCMVFARTWAMVVNRLADRRFDAANPRTANRAFASGTLSPRDGILVLIACGAGFIGAASLFGVLDDNWWPAILSAPVLAWIALYSFTKRFTWLCHLFLGGALAASPIAAAIAVHGSLDVLWPSAWIDSTEIPVQDVAVRVHPAMAIPWLALMVMFWVAGFDVIYALQDLDHDRETGLRSIPARFGWLGAAWISRALHALAVAALAIAWLREPRFGLLFGLACAATAGLLVWEHQILAKRGREGIPMAFFTLNGVVALLIGALGCYEAWHIGHDSWQRAMQLAATP